MLVFGAALRDDTMFKQLHQSVLVIVHHIIRSVRLNERVKELSGLKVLLPTSTRWNSIYYVFERLLRVREAIDEICEELAWDLINWHKLEAMKLLLQPFAKYTDLIQGESYPTLTNVIPVLLELQAHLEKQLSNKITASTAKVVVKELQKRFKYALDPSSENLIVAYCVATFLDPSLALCLDDSQDNAAKVAIMNMVRSGSPNDNLLFQENEDEPSPGANQSEKLQFSEVLERIKRKRLQAMSMTSSIESSSIVSEVELYIKYATATEITLPAMVFWEQNKSIYPMLWTVAVDMLAVPATSGPLEGFFHKQLCCLEADIV